MNLKKYLEDRLDWLQKEYKRRLGLADYNNPVSDVQLLYEVESLKIFITEVTIKEKLEKENEKLKADIKIANHNESEVRQRLWDMINGCTDDELKLSQQENEKLKNEFEGFVESSKKLNIDQTMELTRLDKENARLKTEDTRLRESLSKYIEDESVYAENNLCLKEENESLSNRLDIFLEQNHPQDIDHLKGKIQTLEEEKNKLRELMKAYLQVIYENPMRERSREAVALRKKMEEAI